MSKSTSIFELTQNSTSDVNTKDTRPIVADILKEIEMQNQNNTQHEYMNEQQKALDYQIDNLTTVNDISNNQPHIQGGSYSTNIDNIQTHQIPDDLINRNANYELSKNNNEYMIEKDNHSEISNDIDIDEVLTQQLPTIQEIPDTDIDTNNNSNGSLNRLNHLYQQFRDPLLIFLIAMIITIPKVQELINNMLRNIPLLNTTTGHMIAKSAILSATFYYLSKYI